LLNLTFYLADMSGELAYTEADFIHPLGLILGGEAQGAGNQARELANARVHIPMPGDVESLNAAVAGAILMYEVVRQRQLSVNSNL
jgi:tRNA G18 (ribose-2'-O)-methylase SpoU